MSNEELFNIADRLKAAKDEKKDLDAKSKELGAEIEELDKQLSDAMTEAELDKFTRNGNTFYLSSRLFASPQAGRKDAMISALKDEGFGDIVQETVNANTLSAFVKEQMAQNGDEVPEWLSAVVNTFEKISVGIRKS
ncbi:MAG: hypothetical protein K6F54_12215 [Lachnospiraceae bacterium]|nr:hypothetical protein [Lachnospiraceae bacterium]